MMVDRLIKSAGTGRLERVQALLTQEPTLVNDLDKDGATALIAASEQGHLDVVGYLLEKGADPSLWSKPPISLTACLLAAKNGHTEIIKTLLDAGADINDKDPEYGITSLMAAAASGHTNAVKLLLSRGADVTVRNKYGSALTYAHKDKQQYSEEQRRTYIEIARLLVEAGASE